MAVEVCPPAANPAMVNLCLTLTDVVIGGLWLVIIFLTIVTIIIVAGVWPWASATRVIRLPDDRGEDWKCVIRLDTPAVFAVQQTITADITLEGSNRSLTDPEITFENVGSEDIKVNLRQSDDGDEWYGSSELEYKRPGEPDLKYDIGTYTTHYDTVGEIAPLTEYYQHLTSRFVLAFGVITAILAAASLIVSLSG